MGSKPVYKVVDESGRVLIPGTMRKAAGIQYGDIVRLGINNATISVKKVTLVEQGDQSPEAVEAFVRAEIKDMPDDARISLIADLSGLMKQNREV